MNVSRIVAPFVAVVAACATPPPHGGALPIHQEGVAARLRLACGLGIGTAGGATCGSDETAPIEMDASDANEGGPPDAEIEVTDASGDAAAPSWEP